MLLLAWAAALARPCDSWAQQVQRTYRIGIVSNLAPDSPNLVALHEELRRSGFVGGQNLEIDQSGYSLRSDQFEQHAADLVAAKVDVIVCAGGVAIRAAQHATSAIPVLGITEDMVGEGLVSSMAQPGGNTTGVSLLATELDGKRLELLIDLLAGAKHIAALADTGATTPDNLQLLQRAALAKGVELSIHTVRAPEEIVPAIDAAKAAGAVGLVVLASPVLFSNRQIIFERTRALGLPAMYQWPEMAREGGLTAYGPSIVEIFRRQVAGQLVKLLHGVRPADLPVEQPSKFELVINLKTAKALGLTLPPLLVAQADDVIE